MHLVDGGCDLGDCIGLLGNALAVLAGGRFKLPGTLAQFCRQCLYFTDHGLQVAEYRIDACGQATEIVVQFYRNPVAQIAFAFGNIVQSTAQFVHGAANQPYTDQEYYAADSQHEHCDHHRDHHAAIPLGSGRLCRYQRLLIGKCTSDIVVLSQGRE